MTKLFPWLLQAMARSKAAAVRIAAWYKRCIETRPARMTLKARRQLLPLTAVDRVRQEEEKAHAAKAILTLLRDVHQFLRPFPTTCP